jgi:hypothetical protein
VADHKRGSRKEAWIRSGEKLAYLYALNKLLHERAVSPRNPERVLDELRNWLMREAGDE